AGTSPSCKNWELVRVLDWASARPVPRNTLTNKTMNVRTLEFLFILSQHLNLSIQSSSGLAKVGLFQSLLIQKFSTLDTTLNGLAHKDDLMQQVRCQLQ